MKLIFHKKGFPKARGGNIYEFKGAESKFTVTKTGTYVLEVTALAKNATANKSKDDDDLRMSLNSYEFGKYEVHDEKVSWKGFGTSSSWDGASLKGGVKTVYFFVQLDAGEHKLKFYADERPVLKEIKVWQLKKSESFNLNNVGLKEIIDTDKKGVPWISFIFLGLKPKKFGISAVCKASTKGKTDGDNVKIVVNGKILQNKIAPTSAKYKNFYFSGDLDKGKKKKLKLEIENFVLFEDSVELWYDQQPTLKEVKIEFYEKLDDYLEDLDDLKLLYRHLLEVVGTGARTVGLKYTSDFLFNALSSKHEDLIFDKDDQLVKKIEKDKLAYDKILEILKKELKEVRLKGRIILDISSEAGDEVNFETIDLSKSLHGIKSIEYLAIEKEEGVFEVQFILHDVYDFDYKSFQDIDFGYGYFTTFFNNVADRGENLGVVNSFNIQVKIEKIVNLNK